MFNENNSIYSELPGKISNEWYFKYVKLRNENLMEKSTVFIKFDINSIEKINDIYTLKLIFSLKSSFVKTKIEYKIENNEIFDSDIRYIYLFGQILPIDFLLNFSKSIKDSTNLINEEEIKKDRKKIKYTNKFNFENDNINIVFSDYDNIKINKYNRDQISNEFELLYKKILRIIN